MNKSRIIGAQAADLCQQIRSGIDVAKNRERLTVLEQTMPGPGALPPRVKARLVALTRIRDACLRYRWWTEYETATEIYKGILKELR